MKQTATHFFTMGRGGSSHLRPLATNVPKSGKAGCSCGGACATKPKANRGGRRASHVTNIPESREERQRRNLEQYGRLEREAEDAARAGNEARAKVLYGRADLVYGLYEVDERDRRREAAARVRHMEIEDVLTGRALNN